MPWTSTRSAPRDPSRHLRQMTLGWLGAVHGHRVRSLGVQDFGQTGDLEDLYRFYQIDTDAIVRACA